MSRAGGRLGGEDLVVHSTDGTLISSTLSGGPVGDAPEVLLLHGLTAHRRLVLMGSRALERAGHAVIAADARGHGQSGVPAERDAYGYPLLAADARALMAAAGFSRPVIVGISMGAHTAARLALQSGGDCAGLVLVTPAFDPDRADPAGGGDGERWGRLADALDQRGVEGFIEVLSESLPQGELRSTAIAAARQRMLAHEHPDAVADALRVVPSSRPFETFEELAGITCPTVIVGSRDANDPMHPEAVSRFWADAIPGARFEIEPEGESPYAWRGAVLARLVLSITESNV